MIFSFASSCMALLYYYIRVCFHTPSDNAKTNDITPRMQKRKRQRPPKSCSLHEWKMTIIYQVIFNKSFSQPNNILY